jgi:hypothetical protein
MSLLSTRRDILKPLEGADQPNWTSYIIVESGMLCLCSCAIPAMPEKRDEKAYEFSSRSYHQRPRPKPLTPSSKQSAAPHVAVILLDTLSFPFGGWEGEEGHMCIRFPAGVPTDAPDFHVHGPSPYISNTCMIALNPPVPPPLV